MEKAVKFWDSMFQRYKLEGIKKADLTIGNNFDEYIVE